MFATQAPFPQYFDIGGDPLDGGYLFFGTTNLNPETNPITVYWDLAGTQPAVQPVRTLNGYAVRNGTPAQVYANSDYSITVKNKKGRIVCYADTALAFSNTAALQISLASTLVGLGATLIGSNDAGNYFNGSTVEALLQELGNPKGQFQLDGVNVLRYIPPAEWAAILNYTSVTNLYAYLQPALAAEPNLIFPDGLYNTGTTLVARDAATIQGINRRGAIMKGTSPITILKTAIDGFDTTIRRIYFKGTGCTALSSSAGGSYPNYFIRGHIEECDFAWNLAFGLNSSCIFLTCEKSTFGYYGDGAPPAAGTSTFVAIKSFTTGPLNPNLNTVRNCIFHFCGGLTLPGIDLSGGAAWLFDSNDFEQGGQVLRAVNIQTLKFIGSNWIEGNNATNGLLEIGACTVAPVFDGLSIYGNTCANIWKYTTGSTKGLVIKYCDIGLLSPTFPLLDTTTLVQTLPADGSVTWNDNNVSGGAAGNKVVTGTDFRGGKTMPRITAVIDTTGAVANLRSCSDPSASVAYNGVGDITLTSSQPLGTVANGVAATCTGRTAETIRVVGVTTTTVRVQQFNNAGAAVEGIIGVNVAGCG